MRFRRITVSIVSCLATSLCVLPLLFPCPALARDSVSPALRLAPSLSDTATADTLKFRETPSKWSMEELKTVLGRETGEKGTGYRELKNGRVAMACALLVPGLGQMYNEKPFKAAIALGIETFYVSRILLNQRSMAREKRIRDQYEPGTYLWNHHDRWAAEYRERSIDWTWWSGAIVIVLMIDAYVDAHLYDMRLKVGAAATGSEMRVQFAIEY